MSRKTHGFATKHPADRLRETEIQRAVVALYRGVQCQVGVFSEGRKSRIPPGWPDLVVLLPLRVQGKGFGNNLLAYHETKSATGKLSEAQWDLLHQLRLRGQRVIVGGVDEAKDWLKAIGLLAPDA